VRHSPAGNISKIYKQIKKNFTQNSGTYAKLTTGIIVLNCVTL